MKHPFSLYYQSWGTLIIKLVREDKHITFYNTMQEKNAIHRIFLLLNDDIKSNLLINSNLLNILFNLIKH
ncbi:hypothetical protein LX77_00384 [Gelidibacter algens]|jgi:hypothetical protein|uniref:Uncharacterized protein n=1 Tax=Gelidibacter algens TaxID=49280 RepID=A0A327SFH4_9FLAO|nr:hypothetical protein LX77_00384 [Gelidibacter algens]